MEEAGAGSANVRVNLMEHYHLVKMPSADNKQEDKWELIKAIS